MTSWWVCVLLLLLQLTQGYTEPSYEEFFAGWQPGTTIKPLRFAHMNPEDFEDMLRQGRPFIAL